MSFPLLEKAGGTMGPQIKTSVKNQLNDFDVQSLVDSQLGWEDEKRVWKEIESSPALRRRYDELVAQKKLLLQWWASEDMIKPKTLSAKDKRETLLV
jgi:hypothetical protein